MAQLIFDEEKVTSVIDRIVKRTFQMDFAWDWPGGVAFYGVAEAYEATENEEYINLLKTWVDEQLEDGRRRFRSTGFPSGIRFCSSTR